MPTAVLISCDEQKSMCFWLPWPSSPFLQNMLPNIGTGHYIHVCMYTVYIIFRQNFSRKKNLSPFQKKTLAETVHYIPKGLRKGNPFHGPFAQLSYKALVINKGLRRAKNWSIQSRTFLKILDNYRVKSMVFQVIYI